MPSNSCNKLLAAQASAKDDEKKVVDDKRGFSSIRMMANYINWMAGLLNDGAKIH